MMKVEIWSDIMCPFCYIGKRKFEAALARFPNAHTVEVVWRSYQLDPNATTVPGKDIYAYLAERKGQTREWSMEVHSNVAAMAREVGLEYNFDVAVIGNSFDAHRLIQMAKADGKGGLAEERLFRAYFTEGKDVSDHIVLLKLASELGLDTEQVQRMLDTDLYADAVHADITEAEHLGVSGVPFFVINRAYAVSGAQSDEVFLEALHAAAAATN